MPNRIIKETIKSSPQIDSLSWFEEVVFYRLMVSADDYGCMDGRIVLLKNELFPTKDTVTKKAVEDAIERLVSAGLLCRYTANGMPYLFFPTWEKHQRIRNKHRKYPDPLSSDSELLSNDGQMTASCQSESNKNPNIESNKNTNMRFAPPALEEVEKYCRERGNNVSAQGFIDYYSSNGWKVGKNAMKDWKAAVRTWERNGYDKPKNAPSGDYGDRSADMDRMKKMINAWGQKNV